jgi:hypothetical protein
MPTAQRRDQVQVRVSATITGEVFPNSSVTFLIPAIGGSVYLLAAAGER